MSKDKAGKKDKLKHLDLFGMMLNQSQVFRDMVEQFQSAWTPRAPSVVIETAVTTRKPTKKHASDAKAAPVARAVKKRAAKKAAASTKAAPAAVKPSPRTSASKASAGPSKPIASRRGVGKRAGRTVATGRTATKS